MASTNKNNKKKWTERETVKFVELYEREEVLLNVKLKDYKNKDARNAAIFRVIRDVNMPGLTVQDINLKINNIRSTYTQEKAKIMKSMTTGSGTDDIYVPGLIWFEIADRFLCNVIKSRKTFQNVVEDSNESCADITTNPSPHIPFNHSPDIPATPSPDVPVTPLPDAPMNLSQDILTNSLPDETSTSKSDNAQLAAPSDRKRKKNALPPHITKSIETLQSIKDQALKETEDEFYYFGRNVASQLRQLPLLDALDVQSEILNLIKMKRQSTVKSTKGTNSSSNETQRFTIEIPDHMFILQQATESNHILQEEVTQDNTLLEQAIRSIGGFNQNTPQELNLKNNVI